jgi:hypothetical protein
LPWPRGPLSATVISALQRRPGTLGATPPVGPVDVLSDDDFSLALYLCYELHYRGVANAEWEWDPGLLKFRAELEQVFEDRLHDEIRHERFRFALDVVTALEELIETYRGPSLTTYLLETGTLDQLREFCVHRSAYELKEADRHAFGVPRLTHEAKAALVEIQYDEYGSGNATRMHATLFADTMTALDLDSSYGSYVELLPGATLATVNLVSMFALHRRWLASLIGHLTVLKMTSAEPMAHLSAALARFGVAPEGRQFYHAHLDVNPRHARIAQDRLVKGLIEGEPRMGLEIIFGAAAVLMLEQRFRFHLLDSWTKNRSSLVPWQLKAS